MYFLVLFLTDTWVMVNVTSINKFGILLLEGVLEFANDPSAQYVIEADFIVIKCGRLIVGWPDDPFDGIASIILRGNDSSPYYSTGEETNLGSKAIGKKKRCHPIVFFKFTFFLKENPNFTFTTNVKHLSRVTTKPT
jgi:hypothetical protein